MSIGKKMSDTTNSTSIIMKDLSGFFTEDQRLLMYRACTSLRDKVLIRLLWKSGRRITEVLMIQKKDIDFQKRMILWNIVKKKIPYKAWKPIDNKTLELLGYYLLKKSHWNSEAYLINGGYPTKHISRQRAYQIVRRLARIAGIERVGNTHPHPHHFRHSFAIDMSQKLKSPADVRKLQKLLEHNSLGVTETYLQFNDEEMRSLIDD